MFLLCQIHFSWNCFIVWIFRFHFSLPFLFRSPICVAKVLNWVIFRGRRISFFFLQFSPKILCESIIYLFCQFWAKNFAVFLFSHRRIILRGRKVVFCVFFIRLNFRAFCEFSTGGSEQWYFQRVSHSLLLGITQKYRSQKMGGSLWRTIPFQGFKEVKLKVWLLSTTLFWMDPNLKIDIDISVWSLMNFRVSSDQLWSLLIFSFSLVKFLLLRFQSEFNQIIKFEIFLIYWEQQRSNRISMFKVEVFFFVLVCTWVLYIVEASLALFVRLFCLIWNLVFLKMKFSGIVWAFKSKKVLFLLQSNLEKRDVVSFVSLSQPEKSFEMMNSIWR